MEDEHLRIVSIMIIIKLFIEKENYITEVKIENLYCKMMWKIIPEIMIFQKEKRTKYEKKILPFQILLIYIYVD